MPHFLPQQGVLIINYTLLEISALILVIITQAQSIRNEYRISPLKISSLIYYFLLKYSNKFPEQH